MRWMFDLQRWDAIDAKRLRRLHVLFCQRGHDAATGNLRMHLMSVGSAPATATDPRDFGRNVRSLRTEQRDTGLVLQSDATGTEHPHASTARHRIRSNAGHSRHV